MAKEKYPFNDWMTPLDEKKVDAFISKVNDLARREFGIDEDGDPAVEVIVVDRTRFWSLQYQQTRYDHKPMTPAEREWDEIALFLNLSTATSAVQRWNDARQRNDRKEKESKRKKP